MTRLYKHSIRAILTLSILLIFFGLPTFALASIFPAGNNSSIWDSSLLKNNFFEGENYFSKLVNSVTSPATSENSNQAGKINVEINDNSEVSADLADFYLDSNNLIGNLADEFLLLNYKYTDFNQKEKTFVNSLFKNLTNNIATQFYVQPKVNALNAIEPVSLVANVFINNTDLKKALSGVLDKIKNVANSNIYTAQAPQAEVAFPANKGNVLGILPPPPPPNVPKILESENKNNIVLPPPPVAPPTINKNLSQPSDFKSDLEFTLRNENRRLLAQLSKIIFLPEGETPSIVTISDPEMLKQQQFFANARIGDKVIIYTNSKKVILYSPLLNKIVDVAPLGIGTLQQ